MTDPKLKITFLGTGSAFTIGDGNFHSNIMIEDLSSSKKLLFDCGSDIRFSTYEAGYSVNDIDAVYISHIHADHTGGLEWLGFSRYFSPASTPEIFLSDDIVGPLWKTLQEGMSTLEDRKTTLETYFDVTVIASNRTFTWMGHTFKLEYARHVINNGVDLPCYGLSVTVNEKALYISSDTLNMYSDMPDIYDKSDIIFHDCETLPFKTGVHANYLDMLTLPTEIKSKMWLYHYNPGEKPDAVKAGFKGFVKKQQVFLF